MNNIEIPTVSCILANFNYSKYIQDSILACTNQDYPNKFLVIIDDCSTDDSGKKIFEIADERPLEILQSFERESEIEVKYKFTVNNIQTVLIKLRNNGGPSRARNIGIANAFKMGCHLILVADCDDIPFPGKITKLIQPILRNPEQVMVTYGDYLIQNEAGLNRYESKLPYDYNQLFNGHCIIHSNALINGLGLRQLMPTPYPEDQRVAEDLALWLKLLRSRGMMAVHVAEPLTIVRSHNNDSTSSVNKDQWQKDFQMAMRFR